MLRTLAFALLLPVAAPVAAAQSASPAAPRRELALDVMPLAGAVSYAVETAPGRLFGAQVGGGLDLVNRTYVGHAHFTEDGGEQLLEVAHVAAFVRQHLGRRVSVDVGLRGAWFFHGTDGSDNVGMGLFGGMYLMPMVHAGRFSVGPRILAGAVSEPGSVTTFGVNVAPLVGRVTFRW